METKQNNARGFLGTLTRRGGAKQGAASATEPPAEEAFDADAALARYLAKKEAGLIEPPPAERPVFGRKGL